jgi:hypothetical protein
VTYVEPVLIYFGGRRSCPKGQCLSWPCTHARPEPVLAAEGEALRPGVTLASGQVLCERHTADRRSWTDLDYGSDVAKRLVRPGINLVQIGSPATQLKYGESYADAFRRIVRGQVEVVDSICAAGTACRNLVPPAEIDPEQHCTSAECSRFFEHRASACREIQWERCTCGECALLY